MFHIQVIKITTNSTVQTYQVLGEAVLLAKPPLLDIFDERA